MINRLYISSLIFLAGMIFYAAIQHLTPEQRRPHNRLHLLFSGLSLLIVLFTLSSVQTFLTATMANYVSVLRLNVTLYILIVALLPWFFAKYTGVRPTPVLAGLTGLFAVLLLVNLTQPSTIMYKEIHGLERVMLPWGEEIFFLQGTPGAWLYISQSAVLLVHAFALYALAGHFHRYRRRSSLVMMFAVGLFLAAIIQGLLARLGIIHFPPLGSFGFLSMIIVMGLTLNHEIREGRRRQQTILDHVPALISMKDTNGRYLMVNRHYEKMFHVTNEAICGKMPYDIFPREQAEVLSDSDQRVLATRNSLEQEEIVTTNGEARTYLSSKVPLFYDDGTPFAVCGIATDITERKRAEDALKKSEEKFSKFFMSAPMAMSVSSLDDARIFDVNQEFEKILGYRHDEIIGRTSLELGFWLDFNDRENIIRLLRTEGEVKDMELRLRTKNRDVLTLRYYGEVINIDEQIYLLSTFVDITERKRAEIALRESEERFQNAFEHAAIGMALVAPDGRWVKVNRSLCNLVGYSEEELLAKTFQDITHPDDLEVNLEFMRQMLAQEILTYRMEKRYFHKSGRIVWILLSVSLVRDGRDNPLYFISQIEDITERKQAEEELKKYRAHLEELVEVRTAELSAANKKLKELDRLKSMFIASMSHELRTPLNSIIGFTGMTIQGTSGELNDEQKDNLTRAYFSAKHLLNLITEVIDISKIEAGRIEVYPEGFVLGEVVGDAIASIEPQLKYKGLTIEVDVPPDTKLHTDRKRLLQCLINFLSNAVKYTESGGVKVTVRRADGQVFISVSDTGIGIAEKDMRRLFEPFERLETHLRVKTGGTGLGLYLTRKLATEILRGDISVKSTEGQGSTFTITIPRDIREARNTLSEEKGGDII